MVFLAFKAIINGFMLVNSCQFTVISLLNIFLSPNVINKDKLYFN